MKCVLAVLAVLAVTACKAKASHDDCQGQAVALTARIDRDRKQIATKDALDMAIGLARNELMVASGETALDPGLVLWFDHTSEPIVEALVRAHACAEPEAPLRLYLVAPDPSQVLETVAWVSAAAGAWHKTFETRVVVRAPQPAPMFPPPQRKGDDGCTATDDDLAWQQSRMVETDLRWQRVVAGRAVEDIAPLACSAPIEPLVISMRDAWEGDGPGEAMHAVLATMFSRVAACRSTTPLAHGEIRELVASPRDGKLVLVQRGATDRMSDCLGAIDAAFETAVEQPKGETRIELYIPRG